jgi:hypothetical protein
MAKPWLDCARSRDLPQKGDVVIHIQRGLSILGGLEMLSSKAAVWYRRPSWRRFGHMGGSPLPLDSTRLTLDLIDSTRPFAKFDEANDAYRFYHAAFVEFVTIVFSLCRSAEIPAGQHAIHRTPAWLLRCFYVCCRQFGWWRGSTKEFR